MLHGCLDNDTEKGIESDFNVMEFEMAANVTGGSPTVPPGITTDGNDREIARGDVLT